MTQFFEIISLLSNPTAIMSNIDHQKLLQEFDRAKESESGWKDCAQILITDHSINDQMKFFCMQIIENFLKTRYKINASEADQNFLKQFMTIWLQMQMTRKANEKNFLTKKSAQLFALVSLIDFPNRWPTFFNDLMATASWSIGNADFYLKVLLAIDSEIVDRELPRTPEESNLITFYKDAIRERCVNDLVESWYLLLKEHSNKNAEITCQTLEVIGIYIDWIDINLIVNVRFVEFFLYALGQVDLRETACTCIEEIIDKRMDIRAKLRLIDYLWDDVIIKCAVTLEQQINLSNDDQDNSDYLLKFGKLLNTIGNNLFEGGRTKGSKKEVDEQNYQLCIKCMENKIPFVLQILNHTDDDISESVSEYCMHYISYLKQIKIRTIEQKTNIENMFNIVINKMKYDVSSFNFENEGEDEAMFLEFRKNIKSVFDSIAQLDNDFVLDTIKKIVLNVTSTWQSKSYADIENALYLLYLIAEALPSNQGNHFTPRSQKSDCLCEMLQATITCNLIENPYRIVKLQYFENLARYYRFFQLYPHLIEPVIDHFIGIHGLHSSDAKLRSRVSYLFSRFTKDLKNLLSNYIEKILNTLQDLLIISAPLPQQNEGPLSSDDQLFLYETVSVLIVSSNLEPKAKAQLMKSLLAPVVGCFSELLNKYCNISKTAIHHPNNEEDEQLIYAKSLNSAMSVASRVSKGFSVQVKLKDCDCVEIFLEVLRIFMPVINITTHKNLIHAGFRQYLHRMLVCLDNEILDYLPLTIESLLKQKNIEPKDIYDLIPLLNQILNKFKQQSVGFIQSILMQFINSTLSFLNLLPADIASNLFKSPHLLLTPLTELKTTLPSTRSTSNAINITSTATSTNNHLMPNQIDQQFILDTQFLYKACVQFLLNIANNDLTDIVTNQVPDDIYKIFLILLQAAQIGTQDVTKVCFQAIKKFIMVLADKQTLPNFVQYVMENIVPCCIQLLIRPNVDLNDAQQILAFNEIAQCLIYLYSKFGTDFINYLEFNLLPQLQLTQQFNQILIELIKTNNVKGFKLLREHLKS